jgi:chromate reductase, NAD(P)H dehydrogenase (quinone)
MGTIGSSVCISIHKNEEELMYTIISGTNREKSNTLKVAREYQHFLKAKGIDAALFSLENVNLLSRDATFYQIENEIIKPTTHFLFITPEYNGSFPGILKLLFDNSSSHNIWWNKKALLAGVSTGRAGNLRGMEHLAAILNYLKITVYPNLLPISIVNKLMDENGKFTDAGSIDVINKQLDEFILWGDKNCV